MGPVDGWSNGSSRKSETLQDSGSDGTEYECSGHSQISSILLPPDSTHQGKKNPASPAPGSLPAWREEQRERGAGLGWLSLKHAVFPLQAPTSQAPGNGGIISLEVILKEEGPCISDPGPILQHSLLLGADWGPGWSPG